eukprot:12907838-Prorocentrum_lima.AAC.1
MKAAEPGALCECQRVFSLAIRSAANVHLRCSCSGLSSAASVYSCSASCWQTIALAMGQQLPIVLMHEVLKAQ